MGPFIMNPEGVGRLFVPLGAMNDGPFPEHYEPIESPIANPLHPNQSNNPVVKRYKTDLDKYATTGQEYNVICTTYRLTEHYHYWTKNNPDERAIGARAVRRNSGRTGGPNGHTWGR